MIQSLPPSKNSRRMLAGARHRLLPLAVLCASLLPNLASANPVISVISNQTADVGSNPEYAFTVTGTTGAVTLGATSSVISILPNSSLSTALVGINGKVIVNVGNPVSANAAISTVITVTATDTNGPSSQNFTLTINRRPTLTSIGNLTAAEDTTRSINYNDLRNAADEADPDTADTVNFQLEAISQGSMNVAVGDILSSGETWTWTPPQNLNGTLPAFTVKASDGRILSSAAIQVSMDVNENNNDVPVISGDALGLTAGTAIPDATPTTLLQNLTVTDPDYTYYGFGAQNERVTVRVELNGTSRGQFLLENGWTQESANVVKFGPARPEDATTALHQLRFSPIQNLDPVGVKTPIDVTVNVVDALPSIGDASKSWKQSNGPANPVLVESINDSPQLTATFAPNPIQDNLTVKPFRLNVYDPDIGETFTVVLSETTAPTALGTLTLPVAAIDGGQTTVQNMISGQVSYRANPLSGVNKTATFHYVVTDRHPPLGIGIASVLGTPVTADANLTIQFLNDPPEISAVTQELLRTTDDPAAPALFPFASIRITDPDPSQPLTVTLLLDDPAKGLFYLVGTNSETGPFTTKTGTSTEVTDWLRALRFAPTPNRVPEGETELVTVSVAVQDNGSPPLGVTNSQTSIAVTSVNGAPLVMWNGSSIFPDLSNPQPIAIPPNSMPFGDVTIEDDGNVSVTVSLDVAAKGTLGALNGFVESPPNSRRYQLINASLIDANSKLQGLVFNPSSTYQFPPGAPGRTNFTIVVTDSISNTSTKVLPIVLENKSRTWLVTSTMDDGVLPGTLRHAVNSAGNNDIIAFALPSYPALIRLKKDATHGPLTTSKHLSIKGPGADQLVISGDSNSNGQTDENDTQLFRVFAALTMEGLTLTRGYAETGGACFIGLDPDAPVDPANPNRPPGSLKMVNCAITECKAAQWGGALDVFEGSVTLDRCLLKGNSLIAASGLGGGGVSLYTSQPCFFTNTTFSGNRQNSTAGYGGGAVYVENIDPASVFDIKFRFCTFAENVDASQKGSCIHSNVFNSRVALESSIFADSVVGLATSRNLFVSGGGAIQSNGCNVSTDNTSTYLIQGGIPQLTQLLNQTTDKPGTDPKLQPLAVSVGPTAAYALGAGSSARDICPGVSLVGLPAVDQRGVLREDSPDAGAVEEATTKQIVLNEIYPDETLPLPGNSFLEFYVPRNSTAFNLLNYEVWVDGTKRHVFTADTVQPGYGIIVADDPAAIDSNGTAERSPSLDFLALKTYGTIELRTPVGQVLLSVSYGNVFVNPLAPASNLSFQPQNSLSLVPQFGGSAYIPSSLAIGPPTQGVEITYLENSPPITGPHSPISPGKDNANTPFGQPNSNPLAVTDDYLINEDDLSTLEVLSNDLDADGLDQLFVIDVGTTAASGGNDSSILSQLGALVDVEFAGLPMRGTGISYDPRTALNHLSAGAHAFDTFFYTIVDIGMGPISEYAADGGNTRIVSPAHRLGVLQSITISGSQNPAYNGTYNVTPVDLDSFTIPVGFSSDPGAGQRGSWKTTGTRTPTLASETSVTMTILGANDAPTANPNAVATNEDTVLRIFGDEDLTLAAVVLDTDVSYPMPRSISPVALLPNDTDPDDDDNQIVNGTYKHLKVVGVCQASSISEYETASGGSLTKVTASNHGLATGTVVLISGYGGHPSYNGYHEVTVVDANSFTIPVPFIDNAAVKGLWAVLNNENRLSTRSLRDAEVVLEIRANRAQTNIVYNPRTSSYLNGLARDEIDNTDSFYYAVEDSHAAVSLAKVSVTVTGINDAPVPGNDPPSLVNLEDIPGFSDPGTALGSGQVQYQLPAAGGNGKKDVTFILNGETVILSDLCATNEDAALPISFSLLLSNDSDVDKTHPAFADVLRVQLQAGQFLSREGAIISLSADGSTVTYDPRAAARIQALAREESIIDSFNITINDGTIGIPSVVAVVVTGVNDTPVAAPETETVPEDQLLTLGAPGVLLNDTDIDQNTRLPDNKKLLLPVTDQGTTVFGTDVDAYIAPATGNIGSFASIVGAPANTRVISVAHGLQSGEEVVIEGAGYLPFNGQFPIFNADADSFSIPVAFNSDGAAQAPGSWLSIRSTLTYDPRASVFSFVGPSPNHTPAFTLDGLAQGQTYTDSYTYTMMDGSMVFANDDLYRIEVDRGTIELKVLTNDVNLNSVGGALKIISVGTPNRGGAVTLNDPTSLIYTPATSFVGDEVFIYTVEDELGNRDSALVTARVTIMQLNGNLQANADSFTVAKGQSPLLEVLANDDLIPATGATLSISNVSATNHGGTVVIEGNRIRYTPVGPGAPYTENFTYELSAGGTARATAQVTVRVIDRTNTLPMRDDSFSVPSGTINNVLNVLANDNVLPGTGDAITIISHSAPAVGSVAIAVDGSALFYSPPAGFVGKANFNYTAQDGFGGTNTALVTVEVGYLTTNPDFYTVLYDDPAKVTDDGVTNLMVLENDGVVQGPSANLRVVSVSPPNPALGAMNVLPGGAGLSFNPAVSQTGQQIFTYIIEDTASGHQANGAVTVVIAQQGLRANADYFTVQTDSAGNELPVLANDVLFKPGGGTMSIIGIGTGPNAPDQGGSVTISPTGDRLFYDAAPGFDGVESFTYIVTDGLVTDTARVVVRSSTGELAAGADFYTVFRGSSSNLFTVLGNDLVIPDGGQVLTITATTNDPGNVANPANRGLLVIGEDLRSLIYTPSPLNTTYPYNETFTYEISDGTARRDQALLTIQVVDRIGARDIDTNDDSFTIKTGSAEVALNVLANDNIRPATAVGWTITSVTTPTSNVCSPFLAADLLNLPGFVQKLVDHTDPVSLFLWNGFAPATRVLLANPSAGAELQEIALVQELNSVVAGPSIYSAPRFAGIALRPQTSDLLVSNPTGEQLIVLNRLLLEDAYPLELRQSPGGGIAALIGDLILYTPLPGFTGTERFTYTVSDGLGGSGFGEIIVRVGDISVSDDQFAILSDSINNDFDVIANDGILRDAFPATPVPSNADFTLATNRAITVSPPAAGSAWVTGGKVRFTPTFGYFGLANLTYWAADDSGCYFPGIVTVDVQKRGSDRNAALLSVIVTGVNDPPVMLGSMVSPLTDKQVTHPFAGVTIRDVDDQLNEIITVRISFPAANGILDGPFNLVSPGLYEFIGNGGQATEAIRALVYRPVENRITAELTEPTLFTVSLQDPFVTSPVIDATTIVNVTAVNDAPVITGTVTGQRVYEQSTIEPFSGVNITDVDDLTAQPLTVTVMIDNAINGNLTNLGGFVQSPAGTYTKTGTPSQVSDALRGLVFNSTPGNRVTPGNPETSTFTISVNDGFAPPVTNAATTVIVQDPFARKLLPLTTGNVDSSQTGAQFGASVDISGDTLVVGSDLRNGTFSNSGASYVYERNAGGAGGWGQAMRLAPAELQAGDSFGYAVAIDGDLIAISAPTQDAGGIADSGAVYIFQRDPLDRNLWSQVIKLRAPVGDRVAGDTFGKALALKGATLVVGAPFANKPGTDSGAVFIFEKDLGGPGLWGFKERLLPTPTPIDGIAQDNFGNTLALDGNTLAIGATGANRALTGGNFKFGAVYVFERPDAVGAWTQSNKIHVFSDPAASENDLFGCGLDLSGDTIAVGACQTDAGAAIHPGAAFVFERNLGGAGNWGLSRKLVPPTLFEGDLFGRSVGIDGDIILVGASKQVPGVNPVSNSGFVSVYRREKGGAENWGKIDQLQPSPPTAIDQFGISCAIDHFTAAVGAFSDSVNAPNAVGAGAAYVYDFKFNNAPALIQEIADQLAPENVPFAFPVPPATFSDADYADTLTYSAKLDDGSPIPPGSWLQFDPGTATFSGTPTPTNYHPLHLIVTVTDENGASVNSNVFTISVDVGPELELAILIEEWQEDHFPPGTLMNPALESTHWGCNANPDGDLYSNLVEMMMGTNPNAPNPPGLVGVEASPPLITLLYQLDDNFPAKFVHVQWSLDLIHWSEINVGETVRADLGSAKTIAASAFPPTPVGRIYMRVKVAP